MTWSFLSFPFLRDYVYRMWVNMQPSCTVFPTSRPEVARETALPLQLAAIHSGPIDAVDGRECANRENSSKHGIGLRHPRVLRWVSSLCPCISMIATQTSSSQNHDNRTLQTWCTSLDDFRVSLCWASGSIPLATCTC